MICVNMGFDDPFQCETLCLDHANEGISMLIRNAASGVVDVHDAVDNGAGFGSWIGDNVADRVGGFVKEGLNLRFDIGVRGVCGSGGCSGEVVVRPSSSPNPAHLATLITE